MGRTVALLQLRYARGEDSASRWLCRSALHAGGESRAGYYQPLCLHRGSATTCDYDKPDYHFEATHGEIWPGSRVVLYNVTLRFGNTPVCWFPIVVFSLNGDTPPIVVSIGENTQSGFFLLSAFTWKPTKDLQVTVHADERTRRGFGTGADVQYRMGPDGHGLVTGYYVNDANPKDNSFGKAALTTIATAASGTQTVFHQ